MSAIAAAVGLDVRLQARNKLYAIGVVVAGIMGVAGRLLFTPEQAGLVLPAFYLLGIGGTTYMFGASMVLLEKSERTLEALRTSTMTSSTYLWSKALTLSAFALVESAITFALVYRGGPVNPLALALGVLLLGLFYAFVGIGQVARHTSVTAFLIPDAVTTSMVLQLPFLLVLGVGDPRLWLVLPTTAPLTLMLGAFTPMAAWQWAYALVASLVWVGVAHAYARHTFRIHVRLPEA